MLIITLNEHTNDISLAQGIAIGNIIQSKAVRFVQINKVGTISQDYIASISECQNVGELYPDYLAEGFESNTDVVENIKHVINMKDIIDNNITVILLDSVTQEEDIRSVFTPSENDKIVIIDRYAE